MKKLSLYHIHYSYYPGQGATGIYALSQNLAKEGIDVSVIVAGREDEALFEKINGVHVFRIPDYSLWSKKTSSIKFAIKASKTLKNLKKNNQINIIQVYRFLGSSLIRLLSFSGIKSKWIYFSTTAPVSLGVKAFFNNLIENIESLFFAKVILWSPDNPNRRFWFKNENQLFSIPMGAEINPFIDSNKNQLIGNFNKNDFILIYVGSIHPSRNLSKVIEAFRLSKKNKKNLKMIIVGDGPDLKMIKYMLKKYSLESDVILTGQVPYSDVAKYISFADIGLAYVPVNKIYNLQPPLKTIEYLASGLPVIATETEGNKFFVKNMEEGLIIKDNVKEISNAIDFLYNNPRILKDMGKRAILKAKIYTWKNVVKDYLLKIYDDLI